MIPAALYRTQHAQVWKYVPRRRLSCSPVTNRVGCADLRLLCGQRRPFGYADVEPRGEPGGCSHTGLELSLRRPQISVRLADLEDGLRNAPVLAGFHETAQNTAADDCDPCEGAGKPHPEVSVENETEEIWFTFCGKSDPSGCEGNLYFVNALHAQEQILILDPEGRCRLPKTAAVK
ncbi:MAG: hypothetical protein ACLRRF_11450 [Clostridium fessum]